MKCSHGVIQGYNGIAVVDDRHQVIVNAEAFAHMLRFYNAGDYWYLKKNGLQMSFLHLL
jgi:hypothetical protein